MKKLLLATALSTILGMLSGCHHCDKNARKNGSCPTKTGSDQTEQVDWQHWAKETEATGDVESHDTSEDPAYDIDTTINQVEGRN